MREQLKNRNYLAPNGFKLTLRTLPSVEFYCQEANIPEISAGYPTLSTPFKDIPLVPDKMIFDELNVKFLVDEDLKNFSAIQNWIRGLTKPESFSQNQEFLKQGFFTNLKDLKLNEYSDATLTILTSNYNSNITIKFEDIFPISLSGLNFDTGVTDINYFTAEASFKYKIYNIYDSAGKKLTV